MSDILIRVEDPRICNNCQPVARDQAGTVVDEYFCVLLKGHESEHTDGQGRVWRDIDWLRRRLEAGVPEGKIFSFPKEEK